MPPHWGMVPHWLERVSSDPLSSTVRVRSPHGETRLSSRIGFEHRFNNCSIVPTHLTTSAVVVLGYSSSYLMGKANTQQRTGGSAAELTQRNI